MTSFRFLSADGTTTNVELLTDLIGYAAGSENLTVCQIKSEGTDSAAKKAIFNTFTREKHSVSELQAYAVANDLQLEVIELGKNIDKVISALTAPTEFTAAEDSATQITLDWVKSPGATGYVVTRSESSTFASGNTVSTLGDVDTLVVTGLTTATHYYFRIAATKSGSANSGYAYADDTTD